MGMDSQPLRFKSVRVIHGFVIGITWADGTSENKDIEALLLNHRSFSTIRKSDTDFRKLVVSSDGARLLWPDNASLSAKSIAKLPRSYMDASEFRSLQADMYLKANALGSLLGLSRRAITGYRNGEPIPKAVALSMHFLAARWEV